MKTRPIPAFYCCYLLRSTVQPSRLYIGSTPDPRRRLSQHNGQTKGGANRTARQTLRPWEMTCMVHGFPSSIAALQFEWAWQHPNLTKKVPRDLRKTALKGRSLPSRLTNLHLLLYNSAFTRWPLTLRFFSQEVHESWLQMCRKDRTAIPPALRVIRDLRVSDSPPPTKELEEEDGEPVAPVKRARKSKLAATGEGGLLGLDITFSPLETHYQKAKAVLGAAGEDLSCDICLGPLAENETVVCSHAFCEQVSHITCLSSIFLAEEGIHGSILPVEGSCPGCKKKTRWGDLARELSLRTRTKPDEKKAKKKAIAVKKATKKKKKTDVAVEEDENEDSEDDEDDSDEDGNENEAKMMCIDLADIPEGMEAEAMEASMMMDELSDIEYDSVNGFLRSVDFHNPVAEESDGWDI